MIVALVSSVLAGTAWISPDTFTVQTKATVAWHYVVGAGGMAPGDRLRVADPRFHGMTWTKWGEPGTDPAACTPLATDQSASVSWVTASTTSGAAVTVSRGLEETSTTNLYGTTDVLVEEALAEGDEIVVLFGDTAGGEDCGHEMPDRAFHHVEWPGWEDLGGSGWVAVETVPTFDVRAGDTPATLHLAAPSRVVAGEPFVVKAALLDPLGNPVEQFAGTVRLGEAWGGGRWDADGTGGGWHDFSVTLDTPGVARVTARAGSLSGTSNPIEVFPAGAPPDRYVYWGDIHVHYGHTYEDGGVLVDENVVYGRDVMGLQVVSETEKADPTIDGSAALWEHLADDCVGHTVEGEFVYLLGFEWMGDHVPGDSVGHHNFYFDGCTAPLAAHLGDEHPDGIGAFGTGQGPYEWAAARRDEGIRTVVVPHATLYTGHDWSAASKNDELRTAAEIWSEWGVSIEPWDHPGSIVDGLASGHRFGFIAASDNHEGWMGNPFSRKDAASGLAAFVAPALTREAVFDALRGRSTYATTGARILLDVVVEDGATVLPGAAYVASAPVLAWTVHGTDPVAEVRVVALPIEAGALPTVLATVTPGALDASGSLALEWDGRPGAVWVEVDQEVSAVTGEAERAWSSPFWLVGECGAEGVSDPAGRCGGDTADTADTDAPDDTADTAPLDSAGDAGGDTASAADTAAPVPGSRCGGCGGGPPSAVGVVLALLAAARRPRG